MAGLRMTSAPRQALKRMEEMVVSLEAHVKATQPFEMVSWFRDDWAS